MVTRASLLQAAILAKPALSARAAAALILRQVWVENQSLSQATPNLSKHLPPEELSLTKALCFGVLRQQESLQAVILPLLSRPVRPKDKDILALLLIGAYQIHAMRTPDYAAIDSCVNACRELKKTWACGLVNAVLRTFQQQATTLFSQLTPQQQSQHPDWLYNKILFRWPEQAEAILAANNQEPPLCLRINQRQTSRESYLKKLEHAGICAHAGRFSATAIYLDDKPRDITQLPGFAEGEISVQDEAPQCSVPLLELAPGQRVLDACAAPGGKTCHIAESEPALAGLIAIDIDKNRLQRVEENLQRLRLSAHCIAADVSKLDSWWDGQAFDRILCDAPCSATGVIRRHPDIKYLRREADINQLAKLQLQILQSLWQCLKPGGILLYATCSIMPEENDWVIRAFSALESGCEVLEFAADFGIATRFGRQLFPQPQGHDGFYYAKLYKQPTL